MPCAAMLLLILFAPDEAKAQNFNEAAATHGLALDGIKDGGFAFADINGDGWLDLIVNTDQDDAEHRTRVYFSSGPPLWLFTDVTETHCKGCIETAPGDGAPERCIVFADFNHDGYPDFIRNSARRLDVFLNKGPAPTDGDPPFSFGDLNQKPNFSLYTNAIGWDSPPFGIPGGMNTEGIGVMDYDNDGDLDIFIENHDWGMDIYQNVGFATGSFVHVTPNDAPLGLPITATDGDYAAVTDFNDDGLVDAIARKRDQLDLFQNAGGFFIPVTSFDQQANNFNKGAVAFHDFDNDGDFDLFWTEHDQNRIWIQVGLNSGIFAPTSEPWASAGIADPFDGIGLSIDGLACGDIDNDGDIDIFLADDSGPSYLFINQLSETGTMSFVLDNRGIDVGANAEGSNFSDFDQDGDLDLYINIDNGNNQLWINDLQAGPKARDYLAVEVFENRNSSGAMLGAERHALGATLQLYDCAGQPISGIKEVNGGYGHGNQESSPVHFGLPQGPDEQILLEVRYVQLSGTRTIVRQAVIPSELGEWQRIQVRPQDAATSCDQGPLALPDQVSGCPGQTLSLFPLDNDSDPDGLPLNPANFSVLSGPFSGSISFDVSTGLLSYTPDSSGVVSDSLLYQICDDAGLCDSAWVLFLFSGALEINSLVQQPFCPGFGDGALAISVSGGSPPYSYLWNTGDTASVLLGLFAGVYSVEVSDAAGCSGSLEIVLSDPDSLVLSMSSLNPSAFGLCDGSAGVSVSGGTPPYTYLWTPGESTDSLLSGLCAGTYTVVVTDSRGCQAAGSAVLVAPDCDLSVELNAVNPLCAGQANGSILAEPEGGLSPYSFLWLPGGQTGPLADSLPAGLYALILEDSQGCLLVDTIELFDPELLVVNILSTPISAPGADDATAQAMVSGGTAPYTFLWNSGQTSPLIEGLGPGIYTVVVTDALGCSTSGMVMIEADPGCALSLNLIGLNPTCFGLENGSIAALVSGGTPPYNYLWSDGQTGAEASGLGAGTYSVLISDAAGCTIAGMAELNEAPALMLGGLTQDPACFGGLDGSISAMVSGGTPPYTYLWSPGGASSPVLTGIGAGAYQLLVSDAAACQDSIAFVLNEGSELDLSSSVITLETCAGSGDASVLLVATGGLPPYTYFWPELASVSAFQSGLSAGSYAVEVTDAAGCTLSSNIVIAPSSPLLLSAVLTEPLCADSAGGSIALSVSGGVGPYSILWSTGFTGETLLDLSPGVYSVLVTDASGCTGSASYTLSSESTLNLSLLGIAPDCGMNNGQISSFVSGASGALSYLWSDGQTTATAVDLGPGFYSLLVSDGFCSVTGSLALGSTLGPELELSATSSACGASDGTASVIASGAEPFSYLWNEGQTGTTAIGLSPGVYTVLVTDANGCVSAGSATVEEDNNLLISTAVIPPSACGLSDAQANAIPSGGVAPYSITWSNGDVGPIADSLSVGVYTVTVVDAAGCTASASLTVSDGFGLGLTASVIDAGCGLNNGSVTVSPAGGSAPYTYVWSTGLVESSPGAAVLSGLAVGSYAVVVTDAGGCAQALLFDIEGSEGINAVLLATPVSCEGGDGAIEAMVFGGAEPLGFVWSTGSTDSQISGLEPGLYSVIISDAAGCSVSGSLNLEGADALSISISSTPASGPEAFDGSATALVSGGTPPYTYLWSPGGESEASIGGLGPGTYTIVVTDAAGCSISASVQIEIAPCLLSVSLLPVPVSCADPSNGSISALASGGIEPYAFFWSNGQTGPVAMGLTAGTYSVLVNDAGGCSATASIELEEAPALELSAVLTGPLCADSAGGSIALSVSGGVGPYSILWSTGFSGETLSDLSPGVYSVLVTDASGCTGSASYTLNAQSTLNLSLLGIAPDCGVNNGQISSFVSGASGALSYLWSDGQTTATAVDLGPGFYSLLVSDGFCSVTGSLALGSTLGPELALSATSSACGASDGTASVAASGAEPFSYLWNDGQTGATAIGLSPGLYTVLVTDSNGCVSAGSTAVEEDNNLLITTAVIPPSACGLSDAQANAIPSGGLAPYSITWSNGDEGPIADSLSVGVYTVTVADAAGCTASASLTVSDGFGLGLTALVVDAGCGLNNGSVTVNPAGGSGPYTYVWSTGLVESSPGAAVLSGLAAGSYAVVVADAGGCAQALLFDIEGSEGISAVLLSTPVSCEGGDGAIEAMVFGGAEPLGFVWSTGSTDSQISGLEPGLYSVIISDAAGCSVSDSLLLDVDCAGPPIAVSDTVATHEGEFLLIDVLSNDIDSLGSPGPPVIVLPPAQGVASVLPDGQIGYTPNPGFIGVDSLQYQICNADGCSTATVIIYVGIGNNPPVALPDFASTEPGVAVLIPVGANDFDPDGDVLGWALYEAPLNGTAVLGSGTALYLPDPGFSGTDFFTYILCDPLGLCDTALVTVLVEGPGAGLPIAVDDFGATGTGVAIDLDVLANDIGGAFPLNPASVVLTDGPSEGSVSIGALSGLVTYTPDPGFTGLDVFSYQMCNTGGFCDEANVFVLVGSSGSPPVAVNDFASTPEGTPVLIPVLDNDSDPDGDLGLPVLLTPALNGSVLFTSEGIAIYTPNAGFSGLDVFTYEVCDAAGNCDDAVVFVTVIPVNNAPIANDDYASTEVGENAIIVVLANDLDPDGDPLSVSIIAGPVGGGSASINPDGSITYTPGPEGINDTMTYVACDPGGLCDTAIVVITVGSTNNVPVAGNDSTSTLACILVVAEVLLNDVDPDGDELEISIVGPPALGIALATDDQKIVYFPPDGFIGVVEIIYQACDTSGNCTLATLTIHVLPPFVAPAAFDDFYVVLGGTVLGADVLSNDLSPHGHVLLGPEIVQPPVNGSVLVNPDGTLTYTPNEDFFGLDSLQYSICDTVSSCLDDLRCDEAWVYFTVLDPDPGIEENQPPVAVDDFAETEPGTSVIIAVLDNDFDPDGDPLTVTLLDPPGNGVAVLNPDGTVTYTPFSGFIGCDTFSYFICDPGELCDTAIVVVCVRPKFFVPDVITPNGDGSNDFFVITGLENYPNNGLVVYNRWGDEVYAAQPYLNDWQGTYRDRGDLPDGTYYYVLQLGDGSRPLAGFIAIFR